MQAEAPRVRGLVPIKQEKKRAREAEEQEQEVEHEQERALDDPAVARPAPAAAAAASTQGALVEPLEGEKGDSYFELTSKRRITVTNFRGAHKVDIREFYEKDGKMLPGKRGIQLDIEQVRAPFRYSFTALPCVCLFTSPSVVLVYQQWKTLKSLMPSIDKVLRDALLP